MIPDIKFLTPFVLPHVLPPDVARQVTRYAYWFHGRLHAEPPATLMDGLRVEVLCALVLLAALAVLPVRRAAAQPPVLMPRRRRHHR